MDTEAERESLMNEYRNVRCRMMPYSPDEIARILIYWFGKLKKDADNFVPERNPLLYKILLLVSDSEPVDLATRESQIRELTRDISSAQRTDLYMLLASLGYHIIQTRLEIPTQAEREYMRACINYHAKLKNGSILPATQVAVEHSILVTILHNARSGLPHYMWKQLEFETTRLIGIQKSLSDVTESPTLLLQQFVLKEVEKALAKAKKLEKPAPVELEKEEEEEEKKEIEEEGAPAPPPAPLVQKGKPAPPPAVITAAELEQRKKGLKAERPTEPEAAAKESDIEKSLKEALEKRRGSVEPEELEEPGTGPWTAAASSFYRRTRLATNNYCSTCFRPTQYRCPVCLPIGQCPDCQSRCYHLHLPL